MIKSLISASALFMTVVLTGCSNEDNLNTTQIAAPQVSVVEDLTTATRLAFKVNGSSDTYEYAYKFYKENTTKAGAITNVKLNESAPFAPLNPDTEYSLSVTAYPRYGSGFGNETIVTTRTKPVDFSCTYNGNIVVVYWNGITDVDKIRCTVTDEKGSPSSKIYNVSDGHANVLAESSENCTFAINTLFVGEDSLDITNTSFSFKGPRTVLWSVKGKAYLEGLGKTVDATLKALQNGTYVIERWYDSDANIEFAVNEDATITPTNANPTTSKKFFSYNTKRSEDSDDVYTLTINKEKSFAYGTDGEKATTLSEQSGKIKLYMSSLTNYDGDDIDPTGDGNYIFQW